jgi:glycosyltransferase involved in cell wall biosynthesis
MSAKISIITVNYNNNAGLQKTISSVINQVFKPFEFILIDGNSTDGGKELLQENQDHFTYWVSEPDHGIYHAMNKGIKIATGDYLLFLNSGDCLADGQVLEKIAQKIDGTYDIYYGDIIFERIKKSTRVIFPEKLTFSFFVTDNLSHQATFIKRTLFDKFFFYNENFKIASDWEFMIYAICKRNASYKYLNLLVTIYDGTGLSSNSANYKMVYEERSISMSKYFPAFIANYEQLSELENKRIKQVLEIKKHPLAWKILKPCIKTIFLFLPKKEL